MGFWFLLLFFSYLFPSRKVAIEENAKQYEELRIQYRKAKRSDRRKAAAIRSQMANAQRRNSYLKKQAATRIQFFNNFNKQLNSLS